MTIESVIGAVAHVADAAQERAGRTPVAATNTSSPARVVGREHALDVVAGVEQALPLVVVPRPQLRLDAASDSSSTPPRRSRPQACRRSRTAGRHLFWDARPQSQARHPRRGSG